MSNRSLQLGISDLERYISFANKDIVWNFESMFVEKNYDKAI
jgi:hypothetical protein